MTPRSYSRNDSYCRVRQRCLVGDVTPSQWSGADPHAEPLVCAEGVRLEQARFLSETGGMPLIDVTYDATVDEKALHRLGELLPDVVAEAVDCPEEPRSGPAEPGDIEIRFRKRSRLDVGELDVVIEVRTKLFEQRVQDKQRRVDLIRDRLSSLPLGQVGVWLILSEGAWSQS